MAKTIGLESYQVTSAPRVDEGFDSVIKGVKNLAEDTGTGIDKTINEIRNARKKEIENFQSADTALAKQQAEAEKQAQAEQDARDKIRAEDMLGSVQREYIRQVSAFDESYTGDKTSRDYEKEKKAIFDNLLANSGAGLSQKARQDMNKSGKTWINNKLLADLQNAYKDEVKKAENSFNNIQNDSINLANEAGKLGDIPAGVAKFAMTYETLKDYADNTAKDAGVMNQFSKDYMKAFISGVAEEDPGEAKELLKPENLAWFTQGDYEKDKAHYDKMSQDLQKDLGKSIEYGENLKKIQNQQQNYRTTTEDAINYLNNIQTADPERFIEQHRDDPQLFNEMVKAKDLSGKVGLGKIPMGKLVGAIRNTTDMTVDLNGNPESNLIKAFETRNALVEAGASPEQLNLYNRYISRALTDQNFKSEIAKMANKPSFDNLFSKGTGTKKAMLTSRQEQLNDEVEKRGQEALLGFMDKMADGDYDGAFEYYDKKFRDTYDYVKSDILDVDYVKKQLELGKPAMVELNGNMTKIIGRLPNGEYIIERTGEKINGGF